MPFRVDGWTDAKNPFKYNNLRRPPPVHPRRGVDGWTKRKAVATGPIERGVTNQHGIRFDDDASTQVLHWVFSLQREVIILTH